VDPSGAPVPGATVTLSPAPGSGIHERPDQATTDAQGEFHTLLQFGPHWKQVFILRVEKSGFKVAEIQIEHDVKLIVTLPRLSEKGEAKFQDRWPMLDQKSKTSIDTERSEPGVSC
jgi:hypothetical protein